MYRKRSIFIKATIILVALCLITFLVRSFPRRITNKPFRYDIEINAKPISINLKLTNAMSYFPGCEKIDYKIKKFMKRWEIKGGSLAVIDKGKLVYAKGYGWADQEDSIYTQPGHIFRLASLSKIITATAIMKLQEETLLNIHDKVFGEDGILNDPEFQNIRDKRIKSITIEQLLRHQGGFTMYRGDPCFTTREIIIWEKLDHVPNMDEVIQYVLKQRLGYTPGYRVCYSNVGYLILSKIIEKVSGMKYEDYCQQKLLHPAGCYDFQIANNTFEEKYPNEVRYYEQHDSELIPAYDNKGEILYKCNGGTNVHGLYGAGAWVASPTEYIRFISHIDGDNKIPDILTKKSIKEMTSHPKGGFPFGWVRANPNSYWLRTGTLAGTSAVVMKMTDGKIWMFVTNTSSWKGSHFTSNIRSIYNKYLKRVKWPKRDLYY